MKNFEILQKLPKYVTETQSEQMPLENSADRLTECNVATGLQSVKKATSVQHNKMRGACTFFYYSIIRLYLLIA